jgi:hypothetical protein
MAQILAKDTEVGHVYTSQTGVDYQIMEKFPERVVVLKITTNEVKDDVDPMYGFVAEKPLPEAAKDLEPQNISQDVPAVVPKLGPTTDENRDPAELSQPNAAVDAGGEVHNHNPAHPVRRSSPLRRPFPTAASVPAAAPEPAPAEKAPVVPKTAVPRPAKTQQASAAPAPAAPAPRQKAETVQTQLSNLKTMTELDAEEQQLLEVKRQAETRLAMIRKIRLEHKAVNDPIFFGIPKIDADPAMAKRLREGGVPVTELVQKLGERSFDHFFAKGMRMVKSGAWSEFSISNGVVIAKKAK